jgi:hypothetical protein
MLNKDFSRLIAPIASERFFAEFWERAPLYVRRQHPRYHAELLSINDVDSLVSSWKLRASECSLVRESTRIESGAYTMVAGTGNDDAVVDPEQILSFYKRVRQLFYTACT